MPVDPYIANPRLPNIMSWNQAQAQQASLANMGLRNQLTQEQVRAAQMENQEKQIQLQDTQISQQAYRDSGGDLDKYQNLLMQRGGSPMLLNSVRAQILKTKQQIASTDEAASKATALRWDRVSGELEAAANEAEQDPQGFSAKWPGFIPRLVQRGDFTQQEAQPILQQYRNQVPTPQEIRTAAMQFKTASQLHQQAHQDVQTANQQAQAQQRQFQTAAQKLGAATSKDDYARAWYSLDPNTAKQFPHPDGFDPSATPDQVRRMGMTPEQQTRQPEQQAKTAQQQRANAAAQLGAQTTKDGYARAWYALDPKVAQQFPHPDDFDPQTTPGSVRSVGMSPEQQAMVDYRNRRLQQLQRDIDARHNAQGLTPGQANVHGRFLDKQAERHDQLQQQEQDQWLLHGQIGSTLQVPEGETFIDPTGKSPVERTMSTAWRSRMKDAYDKAYTDAMQLQKQQRDMRARYGWGEFAGKPGAGKAPPPSEVAAKIPEGQSARGPDGTVWKKVNGQLVAQSGQ